MSDTRAIISCGSGCLQLEIPIILHFSLKRRNRKVSLSDIEKQKFMNCKNSGGRAPGRATVPTRRREPAAPSPVARQAWNRGPTAGEQLLRLRCFASGEGAGGTGRLVAPSRTCTRARNIPFSSTLQLLPVVHAHRRAPHVSRLFYRFRSTWLPSAFVIAGPRRAYRIVFQSFQVTASRIHQSTSLDCLRCASGSMGTCAGADACALLCALGRSFPAGLCASNPSSGSAAIPL